MKIRPLLDLDRGDAHDVTRRVRSAAQLLGLARVAFKRRQCGVGRRRLATGGRRFVVERGQWAISGRRSFVTRRRDCPALAVAVCSALRRTRPRSRSWRLWILSSSI